jgi:hypothetical protein
MQLSVEISKYPLADEYLVPIKDFITRLQQHPGITVACNTMSTQLFGDYDTVMPIFNDEMRRSFETYGKMIFICKFINADLSPKSKND